MYIKGTLVKIDLVPNMINLFYLKRNSTYDSCNGVCTAHHCSKTQPKTVEFIAIHFIKHVQVFASPRNYRSCNLCDFVLHICITGFR